MKRTNPWLTMIGDEELDEAAKRLAEAEEATKAKCRTILNALASVLNVASVNAVSDALVEVVHAAYEETKAWYKWHAIDSKDQ